MQSLEILEEVSEGAARVVNFVYNAVVFRGVRCPLWSEGQVVFHSSVAEVEMFIAKG